MKYLQQLDNCTHLKNKAKKISTHDGWLSAMNANTRLLCIEVNSNQMLVRWLKRNKSRNV